MASGGNTNVISNYFSGEVKGKGSKTSSTTQPSKRTHSELSSTSDTSGDEISVILSELAEIKQAIKYKKEEI